MLAVWLADCYVATCYLLNAIASYLLMQQDCCCSIYNYKLVKIDYISVAVC